MKHNNYVPSRKVWPRELGIFRPIAAIARTGFVADVDLVGKSPALNLLQSQDMGTDERRSAFLNTGRYRGLNEG
jgi:hypothetical protein